MSHWNSLGTSPPFVTASQDECEKRSNPFFLPLRTDHRAGGKHAKPLQLSINPCLSSGYEHTEMYRHAHAQTHNNTHMTLNGWQQTYIGEVRRINKSKRLYLVAQQSSVECSAYFEHLRNQCFFSLSSLFFEGFLVVSPSVLSSLSLSMIWESVPGTQKKK